MSLRDVALNAVTLGRHGQLQALRESLPGMVESYASWAVERAMEDATWQKMGQTERAARWGLSRAEEIEWARGAFKTDPFVKRSVWTATEFAFGNGIDGPQGEDPEGKDIEVLLDFWSDVRNQASMFSVIRQYERSNQLQVDGDLLLLLTLPKAGEKGPVQVRRLSPLPFVEVISDPDDASRALYYSALQTTQILDKAQGKLVPTGAQKVVYYRDFLNDDPATDPLADQIDAEDGVYILHTPMNRIADSGWGTSDVICSIKSFREARKIADDQATIGRATAALMNKLVTEGTPAQLTALQQSLASTTAAGGPLPPLPGAMNVMNPETKLEVNRASTNATDAMENGRMMRMAGAAGMGWALHYVTADPANANLATSTAMELPQLKHALAYQSLWMGIYSQLFDFVLRHSKQQQAEPVKYKIPMARMVEPDVAGQCDALLAACEAGRITGKQASQRLLELFEVDNIPQALAEIEEDEQAGQQADPQIDQLQQAMARIEAGQKGAAGETPVEVAADAA